MMRRAFALVGAAMTTAAVAGATVRSHSRDAPGQFAHREPVACAETLNPDSQPILKRSTYR
jgi:hypothetical protein